MKHSIVFAAVGLFAAALSTAPSNAEAQLTFVPIYSLGTSVAVSCSNPGSSQDVAKTPILKNNTSGTIPKGKALMWSSSDGDHGTVTLSADLPPGGTVKAQGKAGQVYTCSGSFFSSPDLVVTKAAFSGTTAVAISITNKDPWVSAGASIMHVEVRACSGALLQSVDSPATAIAAGETKTLILSAKYPSTKSYLRVVADNGKVVFESDENNNVWDAMGSCVK